MKFITGLLKGAIATTCFLIAARADAHLYYDYPAVGTCGAYYPEDAASFTHEANGDLKNSATTEKWIHCGFGARDIAKNGSISAYLYGATNGTVTCTLVGTRSASGTTATGSGSVTTNGNFRVRTPWVAIAPDINNFIVASAYCLLPAGSKLRSVRLFDFTP